MNTATVTSARLDLIAAAVAAIASTLPPAAALSAADALREHAADMIAEPMPAAADEAVSADLVRLLAALRR